MQNLLALVKIHFLNYIFVQNTKTKAILLLYVKSMMSSTYVGESSTLHAQGENIETSKTKRGKILP
jgi:hypothetical protein